MLVIPDYAGKILTKIFIWNRTHRQVDNHQLKISWKKNSKSIRQMVFHLTRKMISFHSRKSLRSFVHVDAVLYGWKLYDFVAPSKWKSKTIIEKITALRWGNGTRSFIAHTIQGFVANNSMR